MSDDIEQLRAENDRLRATVKVWQAQVESVKESFSESVFIPYTLSKAIAKRDITFENLTAEQWFEIYKWFYKNRYDEFPDETEVA